MCVAHGLENVSKAEWTRVLEEIKNSLSSNLSGSTLLFISLVFFYKNKNSKTFVIILYKILIFPLKIYFYDFVCFFLVFHWDGKFDFKASEVLNIMKNLLVKSVPKQFSFIIVKCEFESNFYNFMRWFYNLLQFTIFAPLKLILC